MRALDLTASWPVDHVSAAEAVHCGGDVEVHTVGDTAHEYRIASLAKPLAAWATLVAVEEGVVALDDPVGQPGCTLRHLLAHAGGYAFDGPDPIAAPGARRIYSNTGIELAAAHVAGAAEMPFDRYLADAVLAPLGMAATELRGSPAHAVWSTVADMVAFARELLSPRLVTAETATVATSVAFPELAGVVPGLGRFDPCPWGLGVEVRGRKRPHWTGERNSPATFGHFGGAGTLLWVDRGNDVAPIALVALTDRPFDDWADEALRSWSTLSDAVLAEQGVPAPGDDGSAPT